MQDTRESELLLMPVSQQHGQEPGDTMFIENANVQHPRRHHEFFLRSRPYRGEPPTVAGLLLYPDTPDKMETTSREAFCFRPISQQGGHFGKNTQQESHWPYSTSSTRSGKGNSNIRDKKLGEDQQQANHNQTGPTAMKNEDNTTEMQSQYQKDFPPPSSCHRRRTPALPQPDNIGINPAFRIELCTVQREAFPTWAIMNPRHAGRLRTASSRQPNNSEQ
ncbi:uncharacterized protein LOC113142713 isoform X2 [Mastacembelus armatus]|uniref:uncharacterized protein LOC113142713 isoform X2 n=1 Tax=Mastacembelus armatus TaxID=205130 RepID=UPI000E4614E5|nr:uncharacterized protein LOC113142713 isoform X2 [Mastacembelus armatus]